jgi:DNA mismatch endonuclease, patch repair protein
MAAMDLYCAATRSYVMSRIRGRDTRPELLLRKALRTRGLAGYRVHAPFPGRPDVAFTKIRLAVFVDGCFWHGCSRCRIPAPRTNRSYWGPKFASNRARDRRNTRALRASGWSVLRFWEHQVFRDPDQCALRVARAYERRVEAFSNAYSLNPSKSRVSQFQTNTRPQPRRFDQG